jgi:LuxR family maltose regulon positive regulatory protein
MPVEAWLGCLHHPLNALLGTGGVVRSSLLATKLHRPSISPQRVRRPRLTQRLNDGLASGRQVTLVSAPAGFGKTTCIGEWANALDCPVTWLSLDAADDDPGRFITYLVVALQQVDESLGRELEGVLRSGQLPPVEVISTTLINDILECQRQFLLVLDDLQAIQDLFILEVLEKLVTNLPQPLHLVLITREDPPLPLARLRANNQLTEIRAADLRFSSQEAGRFLNEVMGLSLSPADITVLDGKTEGWIVGLQLAGLSIQNRADPSGFILTLSGSHRFILSYLTEQVLDRQPEEIQRFLLQTSVLDRLNGGLCNAVTGRTDGRAMLERLFNANLFLIPLDDEQQWYRYHHLFADLLRNRHHALQPDQAAELHRCASHWYAQAGGETWLRSGERGAFASGAVQHALAAADYTLAVHLVESYAMGMLMQGYVKTVARWMQAIPFKWSSQSVKANMAFAWMHLLRGQMAQAAPYLERLQAICPGTQAGKAQDPSLEAQWLALQSAVLNAEGKPAESLARAALALEIVPEQDHLVQSLIYLGLADAHQLMDDPVRAADAFQMMAHHGRAAGDLVIELLGLAGLSAMALRRGQLHLAFETASQGVERIERSGSLPPTCAAIYGTLGQVYYQWNQLEQFHRFYQRATQVSTLSGYSDVETMYALIRSRLYQVEGDLEASAQEIQKAVDLLQGGAPAWVRSEAVSQQARLYLARDNLLAAETVLRQSGVAIQDEVTYQTDVIHMTYLRLTLYRGQKHQEHELYQASELARRIIASAEAGQRTETTLQALILLALAQSLSGDTKGSQESLERALGLAEPEGYVRVFLDEGALVARLLRRAQAAGMHAGYIKELLALLPAPEGENELLQSADLIEPLTKRELEVLRLIHEGCSNQEIARRLVITLYTVKKHNGNIYTKLGVNSRTQAVARARQLGLL